MDKTDERHLFLLFSFESDDFRNLNDIEIDTAVVFLSCLALNTRPACLFIVNHLKFS